ATRREIGPRFGHAADYAVVRFCNPSATIVAEPPAEDAKRIADPTHAAAPSASDTPEDPPAEDPSADDPSPRDRPPRRKRHPNGIPRPMIS
ncbi:MAG: hypothetical protein WD066_17150, partial [Planctomycetaceae bacterium]